MPTLLIADDDASIRTVLKRALEKHGHHVMATGHGTELMEWVTRGMGDAVITDVIMPTDVEGETGLDMLRRIRLARPQMPVIVISAQNTLMTAVRASQAGAYEYLPKPFDLDQLTACVAKATGGRMLLPAAETPLPGMSAAAIGLSHPSIIGASQAMQTIYRTLARVVGMDLTVMIHGESGTGKELIARALHDLSARRSKPFIAVNMAAIPRELVESELFGHEKGAFTGAVARKAGTFERAGSGTVFLDEIGDMPLDAQTRLLRVLQQGEFVPVGGTRSIKAEARILCATHRDIAELVKTGAFREDLYFRLNVIPVVLPPLKERREDIPALANHFLHKAESRGMPRKVLSREAVVALQEYAWPGNVRELENQIYRLCALTAEEVIDAPVVLAQLTASSGGDVKEKGGEGQPLEAMIASHLRRYFAAHGDKMPPAGMYDRILPLVEKPLIEETLKLTRGNQLKAAELLGINRNTLRRKVLDLGIRMEKE